MYLDSNAYEIILLLFFAHCIADFPLQDEFMKKWKGKDWYVLFAHSFVYAFVLTIPLYIFMDAGWEVFSVLLISHIIVDKWKCHMVKGLDFTVKANFEYGRLMLYLDQAVHLLVIAIICIVIGG